MLLRSARPTTLNVGIVLVGSSGSQSVPLTNPGERECDRLTACGFWCGIHDRGRYAAPHPYPHEQCDKFPDNGERTTEIYG
jgi:hypothetical protein